MSNDILASMGSVKDLRLLVARNLSYFMARSEYKNANKLGKAASVAPNTVTNLLHPERRTVTPDKPEGYPQLDILEKVADKLTCEVWELLHPDIERSKRERELYKLASAERAAREAPEQIEPRPPIPFRRPAHKARKGRG